MVGWTTYKLYQEVNQQNAIGQFVPSWEYIADIDVIVSTKLYTQVVNDVIYRKYSPAGISKYKEFEFEGTYKMTNAEHEYEIESFNCGGRYTQLLLKEVC